MTINMKFSPVALFVFFTTHSVHSEQLTTYDFDPAFIHFGDSNNDKKTAPNLKYFSRADGFLPGEYEVDIFINNDFMGREKLSFIPNKLEKVIPVFPISYLKKWGVNIEKIGTSKDKLSSDLLESEIIGFKSKFDKNKQSLYLNIPQASIYRPEWSDIPPQSWDDGETALLINYRYSNLQQKYDFSNYDNQSLSINTGFNIGGWRVRHNGYWNSKENGWTNLNTFAQHDFSTGQGGQFTIGQTSINDGILDSFPFEGISVASDDGMIAPWMSTYSPVVQGVAYTPSQVIIRQNDIIIWQGDVPAGPFELQDVFPLYGGNMEVEIHESNGDVRRYTQSSSTLPVLQRKGRIRYHAALGQYRTVGTSNTDMPSFIYYSTAWGIGWDTTLYGGLIAAEDYHAGTFGIGKYISSLGAFSFDTSYSRADDFSKKSEIIDGNLIRFMYSTNFDSTDTYINFNGSWYNSDNYYSFNEYQQNKIYDHQSFQYGLSSKYSLQLLQNIGSLGQVNLMADWGVYKNDDLGYQYRASYSLPFKGISSSLSLNYNKQQQYKNADKSVYGSISIPFSVFSKYNNTSMYTSIYNSGSNTTSQVGLNGSLADQTIYYSIAEGLQRGNSNAKAGNATLRYRTSKGEIQSTWSHQNEGHQLQLSANGGLVLHSKGVTFSQLLSLDGANALVDTSGVGKIKVKRGVGIYTDSNGLAIVPNLSPYRKNSISLDVNRVDDKTEIISSDTVVTPSRGALVTSKFNVVSGHKALISLIRDNGDFVPFGGVVSVSSGDSENIISNIVSENGLVWMSGLPEKGTLIVKWGDDNQRYCNAPFDLAEKNKKASRLTLICR